MSIFQDPYIERMEAEYRSEAEANGDRRNRFIARHTALTRYPVIRHVSLFFHRHGSRRVFILGAILLVFTIIKAPYLDVPFTGEHSTKYTTYVEPAVYMAERNNIFWYQQKYSSDPVSNPEGIHFKINRLPLFEWGLYLTYKAIPFGNLEFKTRLFTHFVGLLILLSSYIFFCEWLKKDLSLLITALISINPVFVFSTFVTVLDSMVILFMFVSFILLTRYFELKKSNTLLYAGIIFGLGISIKYSLLLWMCPISLMIIYYRKESISDFLFNFFVYMLTGLLVVGAVRTSINTLPGSFIKGILVVFIWFLFFLGVRYGLKKYERAIRTLVERLWQNMILSSVIFLMTLGVASAVFSLLDFNAYTEDFLTDHYLLFNIRMYKYMMMVQFRNYMTENILWMAVSGFLLILAVGKNNIRKVAVSFIFGSLVYWILTAKVMFFHNYYTLIIMITSSILAGFAMYFILYFINTNATKIIMGGLFFLLVFPASLRESIRNLSEYKDFSQTIEFIKNHTDEKDKLIYEGPIGPIAIYTKRSLVRPFRLNHDKFKKDIHDIGFADTMQKYGIKYLLSPYEKPKYIDYANLFINTNIKYPSSNRRYLILNMIGTIPKDLNENYSDLERIVREYDIRNKFIFVGDFGKIKVYSFHN